MRIQAAKGENKPARDSPLSSGAVAAWKVVTRSQRNIAAITRSRTSVARRRWETVAPTEYIAAKSTTFATYISGMRAETPTKKTSETTTSTASGKRRRRAIGRVRRAA
ncbi:hypothetical protein AVP41_02888 [Microbacterium sp. TNHR37B]|nr:hypothetical protein AVP41_02888 [Microbacterium sp. TNHR37B]